MVMTLVASLTPAVGVSVAVNVKLPSLDETVLRVPLSIAKSLLLKPLTGSLNVKVTNEVSPISNAASATTMATVGRTLSMA